VHAYVSCKADAWVFPLLVWHTKQARGSAQHTAVFVHGRQQRVARPAAALHPKRKLFLRLCLLSSVKCA